MLAHRPRPGPVREVGRSRPHGGAPHDRVPFIRATASDTVP